MVDSDDLPPKFEVVSFPIHPDNKKVLMKLAKILKEPVRAHVFAFLVKGSAPDRLPIGQDIGGHPLLAGALVEELGRLAVDYRVHAEAMTEEFDQRLEDEWGDHEIPEGM